MADQVRDLRISCLPPYKKKIGRNGKDRGWLKHPCDHQAYNNISNINFTMQDGEEPWNTVNIQMACWHNVKTKSEQFNLLSLAKSKPALTHLIKLVLIL